MGAALALPIVSGACVLAGTPGEEAVDEAVRFRATFGLRSDHDWVASTFDREGYDDERWSVPLAPEEIVEMGERVRISQGVGPLLDQAAKSGDFGGAYLDQEGGGTLVLLFTAQPDENVADLRDLAPPGAVLRGRLVGHSLVTLTALKNQMSRSVGKLRQDGVDAVSVAVDVVRNRVVLGVRRATDEDRLVVRERYGESVIVEDAPLTGFDTCNDIEDCEPVMKGGIRINPDNGQGSCTSGYIAMQTNTAPDRVVMVTAGHCIDAPGSGSGTEWRHSGVLIGIENNHTGWFDNSGADVGIITISNQSGDKNNMICGSNGPECDVTGALPWEWQIVGTPVCRMGEGSYNIHGTYSFYWGKKCGAINSFDTDANAVGWDDDSCIGSDCRTIKNMKRVSFDSWPGDSGGTFFQEYPSGNDVTLLGTHVHSVDGVHTSADPGHSWYSTWDKGVAMLDNQFGIVIRPCYFDDCHVP